MIQKEIRKIIMDEVVETSLMLHNDWGIVVNNFNGYRQDAVEWANQVKNGFYLLSQTTFVDDPNISLGRYYDYVEKIWGTMFYNYELLYEKYGSHQIVASNRIPNFPDILRDIWKKNRPQSDLAIKILEQVRNVMRQISDKDRVISRLREVAKENEGYLSVEKALGSVAKEYLEISEAVFDKELDDFVEIGHIRKVILLNVESIKRPRNTVDNATSTIRVMYELLRTIELAFR